MEFDFAPISFTIRQNLTRTRQTGLGLADAEAAVLQTGFQLTARIRQHLVDCVPACTKVMDELLYKNIAKDLQQKDLAPFFICASGKCEKDYVKNPIPKGFDF